MEKQDYIRMKQKEEIADQQETILMQIDKVNENRLELAKQSRYVRANEEIIQSQEEKIKQQDTEFANNSDRIFKQGDLIEEQKNQLEKLTLEIDDIESLLQDVSDVAYEKAVEEVTNEVMIKTRQDDIQLIEGTKNWIDQPQRKASEKEKNYAKNRLDGVIKKIMKAMTAVQTVKDSLLQPKTKVKVVNEIKEKARPSIMSRLAEKKKELAEREANKKNDLKKSWKLLYLDDDMKTEALPSTNVIKAIVTAEDEMDLEKKNKQSYQGLLVCRILAFGNGTLKSLFDRSQGFYRRQIILETKDVPPDRINDPYLADKMMEEVEGIVLWCIEGLERLIRNDYQFTISNKSQLLMNEMREDDDNILSFLESTGYIGLEKGTHATSKDLYVAYCRWCNDNLDVPVSERSFARRFKERSADYGMTYDKNISVGNGRFCRGFRGVHVKVRTKDVNY